MNIGDIVISNDTLGIISKLNNGIANVYTSKGKYKNIPVTQLEIVVTSYSLALLYHNKILQKL